MTWSDQQQRIRAEREVSKPQTWHLNTRWTMADMEMIERQAIIAVCQRNGIRIWK